MTRREKIILGLTGVAAIYSVGQMVLPRFIGTANGIGEVVDQVRELESTVPLVMARIAAITLSDRETSILEAARTDWEGDPFVDSEILLAQLEIEEDIPAYTGFFAIGEQRIGIIDGLDVAEGSTTEDGRYRVVSLDSRQASLLRLQAEGSLTIEMEEEL